MGRKIGLVGEGITDQIVLESLLYGFFGDGDLQVKHLEPLRDSTNSDRMEIPGNWVKVLDYCKDFGRLADALEFNDFIVIQIDTDVRGEFGVAVNGPDGQPWEVGNLIEEVKLHLSSLMDPDLYEWAKSKILFAIAVHSIECWLLPLWEPQEKKQAVTDNCFKKLATITQKDKKKMGFYLDAKNPAFYRKLSQPFKKDKVLKRAYRKNPSLTVFIEELKDKFPEINL